MENKELLSVRELVAQYNERLAPYGVTVSLWQRYHEEEVVPYHTGYGLFHSLINWLEYAFVNHEKEKKYRQAPNRYRHWILELRPLMSGAAAWRGNRQHAFLLRKKTRSHQGQEPTEVTVGERRVFKRIERRLQAWLRRAERHPERPFYRNSLWDAVRYTWMPRYDYLTHYFGKSRGFWETLLVVTLAVSCLLLLVGVYAILY